METLLKSLLGKTKRPIVINGSLAKLGPRTPIFASLSGYSLVFETGGAYSVVVEKEQMLTAIQAELNSWDAKYNLPALVNAAESKDYLFRVDNFTGALIIQSPMFQVMSDVANHGQGKQQQQGVQNAFARFLADYTVDYFEVFLYLLNRRITAQHMPVKVKGYLVCGFFQPLIIETEYIKSPFSYPAYDWIIGMLAQRAVTLEHHADSNRRLDLTCIAMCDLAECFGLSLPVVELDKRVFLLMLSMTALSRLDMEKANSLGTQYKKLFAVAVSSPLEHAMRDQSKILTEEERRRLSLRNNPELFSKMMDFAQNRNRGLAVG